MNKIALITGATAGFGEAIAEKFAANQYDVIITGRRAGRLSDLRQKLESKYGISALCMAFDVRDQQMTLELLGGLNERWSKIDVLVNNAGLASGMSHIQDGDLEDCIAELLKLQAKSSNKRR